MWELDGDDVANLAGLTSARRQQLPNGCLPESVIKSIVDPDDLCETLKPSILRKQANAVKAIQPLRAVFSSHLEPQLAYARNIVWTILNSGSADVRQARKAAVIWGWDEALFLSVFEKLGAALGPVTVSRGASSVPLAQPASYEGAWASKRKREVQLLAVAGPALHAWCSFHDFDATRRRFFWGSGYKEISAKLVVELAAVLTVDTKRCIGKQSKVTLYVSTMTVNSQLACLSSPCRWPTNHPVDNGAVVQSHALEFYKNMCDLSTIPSVSADNATNQASSPPAHPHDHNHTVHSLDTISLSPPPDQRFSPAFPDNDED